MKYVNIGLIAGGLMMVSTIAVEANPLTTQVNTNGVSIRTDANGNIRMRSGEVEINQQGVSFGNSPVPNSSTLRRSTSTSKSENHLGCGHNISVSRINTRNSRGYADKTSSYQYSNRTGNYIYQYSKVKGNGRTIIQNSSSTIRR
jgi:hypothetical protein